MSGIRVSVDVARLPAQMHAVDRAIRTGWWRAYAPTATLLLEREQRRHFSAQASPTGAPWAPLSDVTMEIAAAQASAKVGGATKFTRAKSGLWTAKGAGGEGLQKSARVRRGGRSRVLTDTGLMMRSVTAASEGSVRTNGANWLHFGTRVKYAARHQFGGTFPVTPKQRGYLSRLMGRWFAAKSITTPARPFLGVGRVGRADLNRAARAKLNRVLRDAAK